MIIPYYCKLSLQYLQKRSFDELICYFFVCEKIDIIVMKSSESEEVQIKSRESIKLCGIAYSNNKFFCY